MLDKLAINALLGLRFWDTWTQRGIGDGLRVIIYPQQNPNQCMRALPNRSGIYVFSRLPGLGRLTITDESLSNPLWSAHDPQSGFILEVDDEFGRFLPFQLTITELPQGVFDLQCLTLSPLSPPQPALSVPLPNIPLFSTPSRPVSAGLAIVRAELRQFMPGEKDGLKASWAVVSVFYKNKLVGRGMANGEGSVMISFPYPQPTISTGPSGLLSNPVSIYEQSWDVSLRVQFYPPGRIPAGLPERPDLCEVLGNPMVSLLQSVSPPGPLGMQTVRYARETIVRTAPYSELYFTNP